MSIATETGAETGEAIDARARLVARARSYLGEQDPDQFFRIFAPQYADKRLGSKVAWCGVFCGALLMLEGLWPSDAPRWEPVKGFVLRAVRDGRLRVVSLPEPGDLVVFGAPNWHHAIVVKVENGLVYSVDGNSMQAPLEGVVAHDGTDKPPRRITHETVFYSIAPLLV